MASKNSCTILIKHCCKQNDCIYNQKWLLVMNYLFFLQSFMANANKTHGIWWKVNNTIQGTSVRDLIMYIFAYFYWSHWLHETIHSLHEEVCPFACLGLSFTWKPLDLWDWIQQKKASLSGTCWFTGKCIIGNVGSSPAFLSWEVSAEQHSPLNSYSLPAIPSIRT